MNYRIGFWIGPPPSDDQAACTDLQHRLTLAGWASRVAGRKIAPVPQIAAFVEAVIDQLPVNPLDPRSPWALTEPRVNAVADTFLACFRGRQPRALAVLTHLAEEHRLCAFDLMAHRRLHVDHLSLAFGLPLMTTASTPPGEPGPLDCDGLAIVRHSLGLAAPEAGHDWDILDAVDRENQRDLDMLEQLLGLEGDDLEDDDFEDYGELGFWDEDLQADEDLEISP